MTKLTNKYWYLILIFALISAVSNAGMVYGGYRLSSVLQGVFESDIKAVTRDTIIIGCSFIISFFTHYIASLVQVVTTKKLTIELKMLICAKINSLTDKEYDEYKKGDFISWLTKDVDTIGNLCFSSLFNVTKSLSAVVLATYAVFTFHWIIGLSMFGITLLMIILPSLFQGYVSKKVKNMSKQNEEFSQRIENLLNGYRIFSYSNEKRIFEKLIKVANVREQKAVASYGKASALQEFVLYGLFISSQMIMLFVSIFLSLNGQTEMGAMLAVTNIAGTFFNGVNGLFGSAFTIKAGSVIFKKFEFAKIDLDSQPRQIDFQSLQIENVNYAVEEKQIFSNLNLKIDANKKYLIVGESGKGKTTLFKLIFGLIDNYEGDLKINGELDYKSIESKDLKNLMAYLPQETIIFNDTLRNNISLFNEDISDDKIIKAIEQVNLTEWFKKHNLDSEINSESKNVSGGEMQRIAIARAIVQDKPIMILDEVTANLDKENREIIENLVGKLDKTVLYISHTTSAENNQNFNEVIKL
ncbi:ABC transporter ATP-binding protein [Spiroplasma chinense]|uniref:ABC transporter ATP-binding protein n=1 Tax=Spiroplasma chinense TaxID=216932 RepID=A0A5B9Y8L1_9MOLU|nr:ABC transporter ATP-binding protein [Spiroplasma chinense]QEH62362.1 ABC transporter ATP-binding protein [Spiroplasma chinense]